jgi:hypothetical protein
MRGIPPPPGSELVVSREYKEYRIELYRATDGTTFAVLHQKKFRDDGQPVRPHMYTDIQNLASEHNLRPVEFISEPPTKTD